MKQFHLSRSTMSMQIMPKANKIVTEQVNMIDLHFNPCKLATFS